MLSLSRAKKLLGDDFSLNEGEVDLMLQQLTVLACLAIDNFMSSSEIVQSGTEPEVRNG